jgi:uncharacterized protein (DUF2252 family)
MYSRPAAAARITLRKCQGGQAIVITGAFIGRISGSALATMIDRRHKRLRILVTSSRRNLMRQRSVPNRALRRLFSLKASMKPSRNIPKDPDDRSAVLLQTRNLKMARSAHAFVRGSTAKFYEWLDSADGRAVPDGPPIWICGDCHVGNLGPVANADGRIAIQIRDLDQTVIGNPVHDLIRLGLSLAMAARGSDLPGVTTARMLEQMMEGYDAALDDAVDAGDLNDHRPESVRVVLREATSRSWKQLAKERITDLRPTIPLGKRFWPLSAEERHAIQQLFGTERLRRLATSLRSRDDDAAVEVQDAAYWVKGCSSLGRLRFAVLLAVDKVSRKGSLCLIDVKEAVQAAAPRHRKIATPRDNAERVVEGARHLSPHLGERMLAERLLDRSVFVRELLPQDLKLEIDSLTREEAMKAARFLASIVGVAHGRQMDKQTRRKWRTEVSRNASKRLDAPSWLWSSIVGLVASHEAAYLEHCRRYALETETA